MEGFWLGHVVGHCRTHCRTLRLVDLVAKFQRPTLRRPVRHGVGDDGHYQRSRIVANGASVRPSRHGRDQLLYCGHGNYGAVARAVLAIKIEKRERTEQPTYARTNRPDAAASRPFFVWKIRPWTNPSLAHARPHAHETTAWIVTNDDHAHTPPPTKLERHVPRFVFVLDSHSLTQTRSATQPACTVNTRTTTKTQTKKQTLFVISYEN
mmetsp:Transcript_28986/g.79533  ORF Transcript_28986/g.79533 Transcript_28986/m.79533 type:complete len:209 (-) Transcript_28986:28-654(-)